MGARRPTPSAPRCWPKPRPRPIRDRIAEIHVAPGRHRRAFGAGARRARSSPASASTRRRSSGPAANSPAAGACAWRSAAVLFLEPELLLLDEPTNYLDLEGTLWLESYLKSYPHTVLIVSHDRDLLNRAVGAILHLDRGKLTLYSGGYDDFEEARREKQRLELKLKKKQDEQRRHIQAFIDRFKAKATQGDAGAEPREGAGQDAADRGAGGRSRGAVPAAEPGEDAGQPAAPDRERAVPAMNRASRSCRGLNLRIDQDDRIALLGQNGNGKSTFAKLIAGRLAPLTGQCVSAPNRVDGRVFRAASARRSQPAVDALRLHGRN